MALKLRLARGGAKKRPFYRIVVAENTAPRDGKYVEKVGTFNPMLAKDHADRLVVNTDRAKHWLSVGVQPTEKVQKLLSSLSIIEKAAITNKTKKSQPKKKAQERMAAEAAAREEAKRAAEKPVEKPAEVVAEAPAEVVAEATEEAAAE